MMPRRKQRQERFADLDATGYQAATGYQSALGPPPGDPPIGMKKSEMIDNIGPIGVQDPSLVGQSREPAEEPEAQEVINRFASRKVASEPEQRPVPSRSNQNWEAWPSESPSQAAAGQRQAASERPQQVDMASAPRTQAGRQQVRPASSSEVQRPQRPPFGLDGFCPVTLLKRDVWKKGDPKFGAIHRGRLYLFASQADKDTFLATPDDFSPVLAGIDPVLLADSGEAIEGQRAHGLVYRKRVFLFTTEENLQRFWQAPENYAGPIRQAMESGTVNRLFR